MCKSTENGILFLNLNSDKHGQKSWDKLTLWHFFMDAPNKQSRANSSTLGQPLPPSPPPTMFDTCTRYFSRVSTLHGGGGGRVVKQRNLKRITVLFLNSVLKTQKINAITQVP